MRCPKCDSPLVERQPPTCLRDSLASIFFLYPVQCQPCKHQFRAFVRPSEHRMASRVPVRIPVSFECGEEHGEGVLTDISQGGCALESQRRLRPGWLIRLHVHADTKEAPAPAMQHLASVRSVHGTRSGLKFLVYTPQEEHQLTQTLTRCIRVARHGESIKT